MRIYNPYLHHRRSIRLKGYDYSQSGLYFVTICCQDRAPLFGEVIHGDMKLNDFGDIAWQEWLATEKKRVNSRLHEFIIMPDHIHGIIEITFRKNDSSPEIGKFQSPSQTIGSIVRGFKVATIKKIKNRINQGRVELQFAQNDRRGELQFTPTEFAQNDRRGELQFTPTRKIIELDFKIWQRNYYESIIRSERAYNNISNYIANNPKKWAPSKRQGTSHHFQNRYRYTSYV